MHHFTKNYLTILAASISLIACGESESLYDSYPGNSYPSTGVDYQPDYTPINDFVNHGENSFIEVAEESTSSFSMDVNTASYTLARRSLNNGYLPDPDSVRVEEFINFFRFEYPQPTNGAFSINMEVAPSYFGSSAEQERHLLRIGIRGKSVPLDEMKPSNLVLLIDVSGSMSSGDRLGLVKQSISSLVDHLRPTDTVAIQTYADGSKTVLQPTPVSDRTKIQQAVNALAAGGGTNGEGGIVAAYALAQRGKIEGGNNRVMIFTDGDFNIGRTGDDLVELIKSYRDRQITLSAVGFGYGGYGDATMERIARDGSGNYFYVDTLAEAERIFGRDLPSTIEVIAQDARIQVEFDANAVKQYRLIGYEKRVMENEDFDKEDTDAAEIGPDHTVTALYELELAENAPTTSLLATVRVRHRLEFGEDTELSENFIKRSQVLDDFAQASSATRFAAAVAEFAQVLRGGSHVQGARFDEIYDIANASKYSNYPEQIEFLELVNEAKSLWNN